ncbi:MAG: hypothetical protein U5P10_03425 [Spirochaetia bacterium]|nr:hypothetical protein [Spirochaetia bacterium]
MASEVLGLLADENIQVVGKIPAVQVALKAVGHQVLLKVHMLPAQRMKAQSPVGHYERAGFGKAAAEIPDSG